MEELGTRHPGLLEFVEEAIRDKVPYPQIAGAILEQYEEEISPQALSNHYTLRIWKRKDAELKSYTDALGQGRALLQLQKENPTAEREELIEALVDVGIITQKRRLMEADPLKLMAEKRRREEGQGRFKIETGKLDVEHKRLELDAQRLENENRVLQLKISQLAGTREKVKALIEGVAPAEMKDKNDLYREIDEIYGIFPEADPAALPGSIRG